MNLWETLLHPDQEELEDADRREVGYAANILQVGEFQLLQLAYRAWHNKDLPEAMVDGLFHNYMIHNEVPYWARHYARQILRLDKSGRLDINHVQYHLFDSTYGRQVPDGSNRFWAVTGSLAVLFVIAIVVAEFSAGESTSMFPPYLDEQELGQTAQQQEVGADKRAVFDGFGRADNLQPRTGP